MRPRILFLVIALLTISASVLYLFHAGRSATAVAPQGGPILTKTGAAPPTRTVSKPKSSNIEPAASLSNEISLAGSTDYAALKAHYQAAANAGDPYARRIIAQIYEYCAFLNHPIVSLEDQVAGLAKLRPELEDRYKAITTAMKTKCSDLDNGDPIPRDLRELSWAQAVAVRDPLATMRVANRSTTLDSKGMDQLLDRYLPGADPETLFEIGYLAASQSGSAKYGPYVGGELNGYAWQIAACRRGGPQMCGPDSNLMASACLNGMCSRSSYDVMIMNELSTEDQRRLHQLVAKIELLLK